MSTKSGRMYEPELTALARVVDGRVELRAPMVGLWREAPVPGALIRPGAALGALEVLGSLHRLVAPERAYGVVVDPDDEVRPGDEARRPVDYGARLLVLDPEAVSAGEAVSTQQASAAAAEGLVYRAPTSGRFYGRPAPDRLPFVSEGDEIGVGQTICLLEVMKTFNRVTYGGKGLPERARVKQVVPQDEADLSAGDVILVLESTGERAS